MRRAEEKQQFPAPRLTDRELEVLKLVAQGMSNPEIAEQLYISENRSRTMCGTSSRSCTSTRMEAVVSVPEKPLDIR